MGDGGGLGDALDGATDQDKLGTLALVTLAGHTDVFPSEKVLDLADILDGDVLEVDLDLVSGESLSEGLVVHLQGLDLSGQLDRGESHEESRPELPLGPKIPKVHQQYSTVQPIF